MKTVVGIIPARWASTRLPGKSLIPLCGKPLIQWVYERTCASSVLKDVIVATDDARIADAVKGFGGRVQMTRDDHPSGTDRIAEVAETLNADICINVQGDEPLIAPRLIDRLAHAMRRDVRWDMATAATAIRDPAELDNPACVKVVWDETHRALYFSRHAIPFVRDADFVAETPLHWRHLGIYGYHIPFLKRIVSTPPCAVEQAERLEQLRALHLGARILVLETVSEGIGIDTPEDVPYVESLIRKMGLD